MTTIAGARRFALSQLRPPPHLSLPEWLEQNLVLPETDNAVPGRLRLYKYQRGVAEAIIDPDVERVTMVKAVRVGFSTLVTGAIASYIANDPASIMLLLPTADDARDTVLSQIDPVFEASPALRGLIAEEIADDEPGRKRKGRKRRNTILNKRFAGGSLKVVAAKSPRNLRRHTVRVLIVDEADAMLSGIEGNPITLAERRTLTYRNRKIVVGSTPIFEDSSHVLRGYAASDRRVFEVPCPECRARTEILWSHIEWEPDRPETAAFRCPHCRSLVPEDRKPAMIAAGEWRATQPDVKNHAGFRLNALASTLPNASWGKLAKEFLDAKSDLSDLQVFTNTILAEGWKTPAMVSAGSLQSRAEPFSTNAIPREVLFITVGVDVQDDRLEVSICGWTRASECLVLQHDAIWGSFTDAETWNELADLLRGVWRHPFGGFLGVDAAVIDAGDGDHFDQVMNFCVPRLSRRVFPGKGMAGARPPFAMSKGKKVGNRLAIIGVDTIKSTIFDKLHHGRGIRFSDTLEEVYYEQLASERRVVRYSRGQPTRRFERVGRARAEALDALVYAHAARSSFKITFDHREVELSRARK
jgi:phage terminase large subunit GpA-like protein